jgi:NodT family efflux transporter outer membrane factor (OMF) lipoprotein
MKKFHCLSVSLFLLLGGCAVGPDFQRPAAPEAKNIIAAPLDHTISADTFGGATQVFVTGKSSRLWWRAYGCKPLDTLIERALRANPNIAAARASLDAARETALAQRGAYWPQMSASFSPSRQRNPPVLSSPLEVPENPYSLHTAQVSVSYRLDVFGGNRRQVEALEALAEVQQYELEAARQSVVSNIILAAIQEAALRRQLAAADAIVKSNEYLLSLMQQQQAAGEISRLDLATQEAALAQARVAVPELRKQLAQTRDQLIALTGALPDKDLDEKIDFSCLDLPRELPVVLPAALVEQRPDVRAAEAQLHAASAQIGVARANMFPQLTLDANMGNVATTLADLFKAGGAFWGIVGTASQTLFAGGALSHQTAAAKAQYAQAAALYQTTVIAAFQNVADTLHAIEHDAESLKAASDAEQATARALVMTRRQWEAGEVSHLAVLTAEQTWQQAVQALVTAQANRFADTAALFQALGGEWLQDTAGREQGSAN